MKIFSINSLKSSFKISLNFVMCWWCLGVNPSSNFWFFHFRKFSGEYLILGGGFGPLCKIYLFAYLLSLDKNSKKIAWQNQSELSLAWNVPCKWYQSEVHFGSSDWNSWVTCPLCSSIFYSILFSPQKNP